MAAALLVGFCFPAVEAEGAVRLRGLCEHFAEYVEYGLELLIVLAFHRLDLVAEQFIGGKNLSDLYEGPHDGDIYLDSPTAFEDTGQHGHALLGKGIGIVTAERLSRRYHIL